MRHAGLLFWLGLALAFDTNAAEALYVRAQPTVPLLVSPSPEAVVVRRLAPGDPLGVLGRENGFVNVQTADGVTGWMRETELTAIAPPAARVAELERELASLRSQLAETQSALQNAQARLRQAQLAANDARASEADELAALTAERDRLQQTLAERDTALQALHNRVAELEMAREAARLLAEQRGREPSGISSARTPLELGLAGAAGLGLALLGAWFGNAIARRRLRHRYHGLEL